MARNHIGAPDRSNRPHSRICGTTNSNIICTTWNGVLANAETNRPRLTDVIASNMQVSTRNHTLPTQGNPMNRMEIPRMMNDYTNESTPNAAVYPERIWPPPIGVVRKRVIVPPVRSVTNDIPEVMNVNTNRKMPMNTGP